VLQRVAVCCSVLQSVKCFVVCLRCYCFYHRVLCSVSVVWCKVLQFVAVGRATAASTAARCVAMSAVFYNLLQCGVLGNLAINQNVF